jgi:hypothetical protein
LTCKISEFGPLLAPFASPTAPFKNNCSYSLLTY